VESSTEEMGKRQRINEREGREKRRAENVYKEK
jgi:hypothetical protein